MSEHEPQEGVIQYQLQHEPAGALPIEQLSDLLGWRDLLFRLQLLGQNPARYEGLAYGNVSKRLSDRPESNDLGFVVSGTQTGGLVSAKPEHWSTAWVKPLPSLAEAVAPPY